MLYFLYNQDAVAVLVCHDIELGEFVLQVPYFPPIESPDHYKQRSMDIIKKSIFSEEIRPYRNPKIEVVDVSTWRMGAIVADNY